MKIISLKDTAKYQILNDKSYIEIFNDIDEALDYNYDHYTDDLVTLPEEQGFYLPELVKNPSKFLYKADNNFINGLKTRWR